MNIKEMVSKKADLIALKKAEIKTVKGGLSSILNTNTVIKGLYKNSEDILERTIIGNTYLWMDDHDDVHGKGVFSKTIKERKDIFHLHDHEFKITSKVGEPINFYEKSITWRELGLKNKSGGTEALFMDTKIIKQYNSQIFNEYKNSKINQHSVGMQYVKIDLAVNDDEFKEENKLWNEHIDTIGNKEKAIEKGYFWLVREAKLIEISAVLIGSNELTPTLENKSEADNITSQNEAVDKHFNVLEAIQKISINI